LIERYGQAGWRFGSEEIKAVGMMNVRAFQADVVEEEVSLGSVGA